MPDILLSATGIGATLLACGASIILVIFFHRAYQQQSAATRNGNVPLYAAYKNLSMAGARLALLVTIFSLLVAIVAVIVLSTQAIYPRAFVFVGISLCIIIAPCLVLPRFLFDLFAILYVDGPALAEFQESDITLRQAIAFSIRSIFFGQPPNDRRYRTIFPVSLSSFLLFEATGMLFLLNLQRYLWLIPALAVFLHIVGSVTKNYLLSWIARVESLEQTQWATLEPRLRQFAERAGIEMGGVRMQTMTRVGSAVSLLYGWRRPTLLLSDIFLKNSDWRQQDALIAIMLGLIKRRMPLINILLSFAMTAVLWTFIVALSAVVAALDSPIAPSTALAVLYNAYALCIILVIARFFYASKQTMRYRYAMDLTGDPLAVLAVVHTIGWLTTTPPPCYAWQSKQMRRLEQFARQTGSRAPWANRPVPSIASLVSDSGSLTVSPGQVSPPEPIADESYPEATLDKLSIPG